MKLETLQLIYNLILKYHKIKWVVKFDKVLLGKNITIVYNLCNFLKNYEPKFNCYGLEFEKVTMDKANSKFFREIEEISGVDINDFRDVVDHMYDAEEIIRNEAAFFYDLHLKNENLNYIHSLFYTDGKLNTWKVVAKNYDPDVKLKTTSIKLTNSYTAIVAKGKPVEVGCQRIPIETIREIIKAYEAL